MVAFPQWWNSAKTAQISSDIAPSVAAGSTVAAVAYWLFNDKGSLLGATTLTSPLVWIEAWDGVSWVRSGMPILDEAWVEASVTGVDKTGDAGMADQTTSYAVIGSGRPLALTTISVGCGREITVRVVVPLGASEHGRQFRLFVDPAGTSTAAFPANASVAGTLTVTGATTLSNDVTSGNVAYTAGDYTASTGSWTVDSADKVTLHYVRLWSVMLLSFEIANTDVSASTLNLRIKLPESKTIAKASHGKFLLQDASSVTWASGNWQGAVGANYVALYKDHYASNWTITSSDNTTVRGVAILFV